MAIACCYQPERTLHSAGYCTVTDNQLTNCIAVRLLHNMASGYSCEGLPGGPCPSNCHDETVKYSIYDLFLCPSCADTRGAEETQKRNTVASGSTRSAGAPETNSKSNAKTVKPSETGKAPKKRAASCQYDSADEDNVPEQCASCLGALKRNSTRVKCQICSGLNHFLCTGVPEQARRQFMETIKHIGWVCNGCRSTARSTLDRLQAEVADLTEMISTLKADILSIREAVESTSSAQTIPKEPAFLNADVMNMQPQTNGAAIGASSDSSALDNAVHRLLRDADRRKRNVIITGLPENDGIGDEALFLSLCETHLRSKPIVTSCQRIGKMATGKPRRLLVRLRSDDAASQLLKDARLLRRVEDTTVARTVYINPDLAPTAAKIAYEERQLRRAKKRHNNQQDAAAGSREPSSTTSRPITTSIVSDEAQQEVLNISNPTTHLPALNPDAQPFLHAQSQ